MLYACLLMYVLIYGVFTVGGNIVAACPTLLFFGLTAIDCDFSFPTI